MPRNGSNIYSPPAGTTATPNTPIESAKYNAFVADLTNDLNLARPIVAGGTGANTKSGAQQALDLEPGVDIQAYNATLAALAALTLAADKLIYATGANTLAAADLTSFARTLLAGVDAAAMRTTLGLGAFAIVSPTGTPDGRKFLRDDNSWQVTPSWELINTFTPGSVTNVEIDLTNLRAAKITYDMCSPTVTATFRAELRGTVTGWSLANTLNGGVTAAQGVYGELLLYPWEETQLHVIRAAAATATVRAAPTSRLLTSIIFTAEWMTDQALDRLRLSWDTGNFDGGRILLHGVRG